MNKILMKSRRGHQVPSLEGLEERKENSGRKSSRRLVNKPSKQASTVMFVPWTSTGKLIGKLKEEEERVSEFTGFKVSFRRK